MALVKCDVCGLEYTAGVSSETRRHRLFHDEALNGILVKSTAFKQVIWRDGDHGISVVTPESSNGERILARKLGRLANRETHYDFGLYDEGEPPDERNLHLFVYVLEDRLIALQIFERRSHIWRSNWDDYDAGRDPPRVESSPIWSLGFAWVHRRHRQRGIASAMFDRAAQYLGVSRTAVGLYTPFTADGKRFARALFPVEFLVAR